MIWRAFLAYRRYTFDGLCSCDLKYVIMQGGYCCCCEKHVFHRPQDTQHAGDRGYKRDHFDGHQCSYGSCWERLCRSNHSSTSLMHARTPTGLSNLNYLSLIDVFVVEHTEVPSGRWNNVPYHGIEHIWWMWKYIYYLL